MVRLKELSLSLKPQAYDEQITDNLKGLDMLCSDFPILVATQKAVTHYEGILKVVGPRENLFKKFLAWIGLVPSTPKQKVDFDLDGNGSESSLSSSFISRISLNDIWKPASPKSCGNDFRKMLRTAISILFSPSILQMKIYARIPIPDLPVVFPHKKLSFCILDTLLVNRTLYEKTVASGFGSIHFLLDASEQQLYKEAILVYAMLLKVGNNQQQETSTRAVGERCENFLYNLFQEKIEMAIGKAMKTLKMLGLAVDEVVGAHIVVQALPFSRTVGSHSFIKVQS